MIKLLRGFCSALKRVVLTLPGVVMLPRLIRETAGTAGAVTAGTWFLQRILGFNRQAYWPMSHLSVVSHANRIRTGIGTAPGLSPGCYIQGGNGIVIGDYTLVAPNVGLISANHSPYCLSKHLESGPIQIGEYCWIGMNSVVLPGVELGDHTIVAANSVVNSSFPDGYCVLAGSPAVVVKQLDRERVEKPRNPFEYVGYHKLEPGAARKEALFAKLGIQYGDVVEEN